MNVVKKCKDKAYASKIGPNTPEEASAIHRGVYDAADVWHPKTFAKKLVDVTEQDFESFEDKECHYYVGTFVSLYVFKWIGVYVALNYLSVLLSFF
jgi:hypothetical protein